MLIEVLYTVNNLAMNVPPHCHSFHLIQSYHCIYPCHSHNSELYAWMQTCVTTA